MSWWGNRIVGVGGAGLGSGVFLWGTGSLAATAAGTVQGAGNPTGMGVGKWCECGETMEGKSHHFVWMIDRKAADREAGIHCDARAKVEISVAGEA